MCFSIITYKEWLCGWREHVSRQNVDCRRSICRLSDRHRVELHDCQNTCVGTQTEDHHLVMSTLRVVCRRCQEAGRGAGEHPGNGNAGFGHQFSYVVANYGPA